MPRGHLESIWLKPAARAPMRLLERVGVTAGRGIDGNANGGGRRQITVLDLDAWDRVENDLGASVDPAARRANLGLRGLDLEESRGRVLRVGDVRIRIGGETRPCRRMDDAHAGLQWALDPEWRGGAYGVALDDGEIRVGDEVAWEADDAVPGDDATASSHENT